MTLNKKLLSFMLAALIALLAACGDDGATAEDKNNEEKAKQEEASGEKASGEKAKMPEPDLEGVPEVVAKVNDEEIKKKEFTETYKSQFQQMAMQSQMTGKEVDQDKLKKQVAESLVGQTLLIQEANSRDFTVSEEEKNKKLEEIAKQQKLESKEKFLSKLEEQGMKEEEVMAQVEKQMKLEKLLAEEAGDLEPTEKEMKEAYEQMKKQQEKAGGESKSKVPSYEEAKPMIKQQLSGQKEAQAYQKLVEDLKKDADVKVNV
ncbi:SurA N-terminal domain-containing protein [Halobacillus mangrovi]|uniref:SurA N-terminal domain-containing protein n=1 Tax=Halobacillus mangrovi TaxID=402384 RepID=UPI0012F52564|nr:SurA N-terminal domain-containing protein [Halobacillus mangrovi]